jgi:thiamine biosynthesis lipoprotein
VTATATLPTEHRETFPCFGSQCTVIVADANPACAPAAVRRARARLLDWHARFSRFEPASELSQLNRDPRLTVPVSPLMRRIVEASVEAARRTGGLVDPTLMQEIERAGYTDHLEPPAHRAILKLDRATPAGPHPDRRWRAVRTDRRAGTVTRPPGTMFDDGGIAKGVFADELAASLAGHDAFVVDCGGDLRLGGTAALPREVHVAAPTGERLHTLTLTDGAVATSGITKRAWTGPDGRPAHHLLDPRTGRPAFTGIVQATALAPTATEAEALSKAALVSGLELAGRRLTYGGLLVLADGCVQLWRSSQPHRSSSTRACSGSLKISW